MRLIGLCCVLVGLTPATASAKTVNVAISCSTDGKLATVRIASGASDRVIDPEDTVAIRRALPDRNADIIISNAVDTPYRCIGGLIYRLQRLGYRHVGFINEPPPQQP